MNFVIAPTFKFHFTLSLAQINAMIEVAEKHYDATCRNAANSSSGVLREWHKASTLWPINVSGDVVVTATFRELDLVCKILEPGNVPRKLQEVCTPLFVSFGKALAEASFLAHNVRREIDL